MNTKAAVRVALLAALAAVALGMLGYGLWLATTPGKIPAGLIWVVAASVVAAAVVVRTGLVGRPAAPTARRRAARPDAVVVRGR